jgi:formyltetrahydrofolate synthetase
MKKNIKMIITIILMITLIVGCTKNETKEENEIDKLRNMLTKVAEKTFLTDEWTKGGIREDIYTITLIELAQHNQLKLVDYKNSKTGNLCDEQMSNIQFIVNKQTEPDKTNYELKVNLICE